MITIFNRKELISTFDLEKQRAVRATLSQHGIDYYVKVIDLNNGPAFSPGRRASFGTLGEKIMQEYRIYVNKKDLDEATFVINQRPN